MSEVKFRVPANVRPRAVSAVRDFPRGCGMRAASNPNAASSEASSTFNGPRVEPGAASNTNSVNFGAQSEMDSTEIALKSPELELPEAVAVKGVRNHGNASCQPEKSVIGDVKESSEAEKFGVDRERRVWAVRTFPPGCGRGAPKVTIAPTNSDAADSAESKVFYSTDQVGLMNYVNYEETLEEIVGETKREKQKAAVAEGSARGVSPAKMVKADAKMLHQTKKYGEFGGSNPSLKSSPSDKKMLIRSGPKKKVVGHVLKQVGKNTIVNKSRDAGIPRGIKISDNGGRSFVGRSVDKGAINVSKDGNNLKRKLQSKEGNKSVDDRLKVQGMMVTEKRPMLNHVRKPSGIVSRPVAPNFKEKKGKKLLGGNSACLSFGGDNEMAFTIYNGPQELCKGGSSSNNKEAINRNMVKLTLRQFQLICRKLIQEEEKSKRKLLPGEEVEPKINCKNVRFDLVAAGMLKNNKNWVNHGEAIIGHVPGVEVGDEFHYRVELAMIGIHRPYQGGIDYTRKGGKILATSIVASGGYPDDFDSSDVLIYSGAGGNPAVSKDREAKDQKLLRGNLALKNSIDAQTPVRVVYGSKELIKSNFHDGKPKLLSTFVYDGLYLVEKYWPEEGPNKFIVYKFKLRRMPGQPEISLKEVKKTRKLKVREGLCVKDISAGKERIPICAVNTVDSDRPMPFKYITKIIYPSRYAPKPPRGCDCKDGCLDSESCACAVRNGGEIPFNFDGAIIQAKPLVYECGPSCKCPPSCRNRVSQHGIRLPLEIFKTKTKGWGVRSLYSIPSGTFVCEYIGEMLHETEAEQRINDEYLFDIGHNCDEKSWWGGLPSFIPRMQSDDASGTTVDNFTIDAAMVGNLGRFINHSCSPNLYAQNLLFDHDDKKMLHVMLFAVDNIPPLQELTYHYNYTVDQVRDAEGNIKKKECHCGSSACTGRLY